MSHTLQGRRILIVEDEAMIAMLVEDMLADLGCAVIGPAHDLGSALALAEEATIDAAVLDVNLGGQTSFAVADALRRRGAPVIFATGYGEAGLRPGDAGAPVLRKPYRARDLEAALRKVLP